MFKKTTPLFRCYKFTGRNSFDDPPQTMARGFFSFSFLFPENLPATAFRAIWKGESDRMDHFYPCKANENSFLKYFLQYSQPDVDDVILRQLLEKKSVNSNLNAESGQQHPTHFKYMYRYIYLFFNQLFYLYYYSYHHHHHHQHLKI